MDLMGVKYFGEGSKIILTSRDRQVLKNGGADKIHEVNKLNENDSLQLFSTFAFKLLNPALDFQDLSNKFLEYAQGNPLALKVLGSKLYTKSRKEWEGEVDKLKEYPQQKISQILKSSFDELDELEKNIFLDIACFFKQELKEDVEEILSCLYKGAACGISNLLDKCLVHIDSYRRISMHDMLEEMGKDIIIQRSKHPEKRSRLWSLKDVNQVLRYNKENKSIEGIRFEMTRFDSLLSRRHGFENILNLRYIDLDTECLLFQNENVIAHNGDSVSFPDELRYLCWSGYPFKSLPPNYNPKNLAILKLHFGCMEQLWNEDHQDLVNLRIIDLFYCIKLRKIPNLSRAINLKSLCCRMCESLVELPCLGHLPSLEILDLSDCTNLRKIPNLLEVINLKGLNLRWCLDLVEPLELPNNITELNLSHTVIKEVADYIQHLVGLRELNLSHSWVKNVSNNISKFESLRVLVLDHCESLKTLPELPRYLWFLDARNCTSLEKVSFTDDSFNPFHSLHDGDGAPRREIISMLFSNCRSLNQDSIKNIVANTMLQIHSLAQRWVRRKGISLGEYRWDFLFCCFPGNEVPEIVFYYRSMDYSFDLKITPNGFSGSRLLAFAVCLVADLTLTKRNLEFICKYRLTTTSGEKFASKCCVSVTLAKICNCKGDHVFILFNQDMIIIDNDYEEASFELYIRNLAGDEFKVEKCGVNIFYMDAEGYTISDVMRWDKSNQNSDSQEVANIEVAHDGSATEIRPGDERRFGNGGEEGDGGPKTLK
ncbi:disease resistance protein RPV1-like [Hibiscus syriacus]|uniref:disease resistance protein RPV1-like n=1 Tax=Hibiscus syriacus TaxID=106335 RepID=UPI00192489E2|nr:disease resistance protein RPV1-like [Hibiscus syriacus]